MLFHATPRDDLEMPARRLRAGRRRGRATVEEVAALLDGVDARLILCGHTHVPRLIELPDGRWVLNPGSVGLQAYRDHGEPPWAIGSGSPHARLRAPASRGRPLARRAAGAPLRLGERGGRGRAAAGNEALGDPDRDRLARPLSGENRAMAAYTKLNFKQDVEDMAPKFGLSPGIESHFARVPLGARAVGRQLLQARARLPLPVRPHATASRRRSTS